MEFILELFMEIALELYVGLAVELLPEHKFKKWQTVLLKVLCVLVSVGSLVLIIGGIVFLVEGTDADFIKGIAMLIPGAIIVLAHIVIFLVVAVKEQKRLRKDKEHKEETEDDR